MYFTLSSFHAQSGASPSVPASSKTSLRSLNPPEVGSVALRGKTCSSLPSPDWICSRYLVRVHSQACNGEDRAFEISLMNDMVEGHNPALLVESTGANRFINGAGCFDRIDFNDTIK